MIVTTGAQVAKVLSEATGKGSYVVLGEIAAVYAAALDRIEERLSAIEVRVMGTDADEGWTHHGEGAA